MPISILAYLLFLPGLAFLPLGLLLILVQLNRLSARNVMFALLVSFLTLGLLMELEVHWSTQSATATGLRVATVNVAGWKSDLPAGGAALSALNLDVIFLQEVWNKKQRLDLQNALPGYYFAPVKDSSKLGMLIGTKRSAWTSPITMLDQAISQRIKIDGLTLCLINVHGRKSFGYSRAHLNETLRLQREQRRSVLLHLRSCGTPAIVAGDFNAPPSSPMMRHLRMQLSDSFHQSGQGFGYTFPAEHPLLRIDQVLATSPLVAIRSQTVNIGSDHLAVVVEYARP